MRGQVMHHVKLLKDLQLEQLVEEFEGLFASETQNRLAFVLLTKICNARSLLL